jgi:UDP-GlcNAc3NAcA epimerase
MHPRTRKIIESAPQLQKIISESKIIATEPIGYLDMIRAEQNARLILTDSGGVQKEAFFHKIPCVTLRTETEWVELVDSGWNVLAGTKPEKIIECTNLMLTKNIEKLEYPDLYGSGKAGHNIANALFEWSKK